MNNRKWLVASFFSVAYALVLGVGELCFLHLLGDLLVGMAFGESVLSSYPRFVPFCMIMGCFALIALIALFCINLKLAKRFIYTKSVWCVQMVCAFVFSVPMIMLWDMVFDFLQEAL